MCHTDDNYFSDYRVFLLKCRIWGETRLFEVNFGSKNVISSFLGQNMSFQVILGLKKSISAIFCRF